MRWERNEQTRRAGALAASGGLPPALFDCARHGSEGKGGVADYEAQANRIHELLPR